MITNILLGILLIGVIILIIRKKEPDNKKNILMEENARFKADLGQKDREIGELKNEKTLKDQFAGKNKELSRQITNLEAENVSLANEKELLIKKISDFEATENNRKKEYEKNITELNTLRGSIEFDRQKIQREREEEIKNNFEQQKLTWTRHETVVEEKIKEICRKYTIEYINKEKIPFRGKPDNTIKICDEYVIFDAKSPANNDLNNFPSYIKLQTESVKKYIKEAEVKKDIFLVVPSNTSEIISEFTYNMGDYNVYIITADALEPIILSLKKIEEYEFAEQLSPEDRNNICRVIGKFIHTTKRKIEIDYFFTKEFLSIIKKAQIDLPEEILEKVVEFEVSEKLNPPTEKRAKQIQIADLEKNTNNIKPEIEKPKIED